MNRETFPAGLAPLTGDVSAPAGATQVTVVGLQHIPIAPGTPNDQNLLRFNQTTNSWGPSQDTNSVISVNGVPVSDDWIVSVNAAPQITVNGV